MAPGAEAMQDRARLTLSETRVATTAGASDPSVVTLEVTNTSQYVDQFIISISGGMTDWYSVEPEKLSLFPGESGETAIRIHPPRRHDVIAGTYPLTVTVTSRDQSGIAGRAQLMLELGSSGSFEAELVKATDSGETGTFVLRLANLSDGALRVSVSGGDPGQRLLVELPFATTTLQPYQDLDSLPVVVRPRQVPAVSAPLTLEFHIDVSPEYPDPSRSAAARKRLRGSFTLTPAARHADDATSTTAWKLAAGVIAAGAVAHFGLDKAFDKINWWTWPGLAGFGLLYATTLVAVVASRRNAGALPWLLLLGGLPVLIGAAIAAAANDFFWLLPAGILVAAIVRGVIDNRRRRHATRTAAVS
jgi:hypothetical protein